LRLTLAISVERHTGQVLGGADGAGVREFVYAGADAARHEE
jgi:hypothetical protein